jgi:hypothetical protein
VELGFKVANKGTGSPDFKEYVHRGGYEGYFIGGLIGTRV